MTNFKPLIDKKNRNKIIAIVVGIVLAAICGVSIKQMVDKQNLEKAEANYKSNLSTIMHTMLSGASDAESACNLIKKVWYNSIYEERDTETDKYTKPKGYFSGDFNDALELLFSDTSFSVKIQDIKTNQVSVKSMMKTLQNPPDEYESAYDSLKELYDAYLDLTNLAINPTGSLQLFSSNFNDANGKMLKCYNAMEIYAE